MPLTMTAVTFAATATPTAPSQEPPTAEQQQWAAAIDEFIGRMQTDATYQRNKAMLESYEARQGEMCDELHSLRLRAETEGDTVNKKASFSTDVVVGALALFLFLACYANCQTAEPAIGSPAVQAQMYRLYSAAAASYFGQTSVEFSFTVDAAGSPREVTSSNERDTNHLLFYPGDRAIVHTHPKGTDPRPSDGDIATAKKCGVPNYELSVSELWVATPDGKYHRVGSVRVKHGVLEVTK
jgi:proteasome lid subunit RPN8/RPN11